MRSIGENPSQYQWEQTYVPTYVFAIRKFWLGLEQAAILVDVRSKP